MNKRSEKTTRGINKIEEVVIVWLLRIITLISILTTIGIVYVLLKESLAFFVETPENRETPVSVMEFLTGINWTPLFNCATCDPPMPSFGVLPLVVGTLLVAFIAGIIALALGLCTAIFLSEYAPEKLRKILKPVLEILAGIPTVVYGYFALTLITPFLRTVYNYFELETVFGFFGVFNALSAGLVMGLMIMPMVSTLSEDAMMSVPKSLRDAAYSMGATRFEVSTKVVVPAALSGIVASFILALSRAIGETMIVTLAAGATPNLTFNPIESIQAMTGYIVNIALGEAPHGSIEYQTLFAVGLLLFLITLLMNILGRWVISRYRQVYD
ncbi:MAG: phosphate ABC transporter permease subunit PstC [Chloroflexi bacterium]|nr:phosphate ABC transporter permease subunit PstC [Chloroflexota bacterium]